MKISKFLVLILLVISLIALAVASQISQVTNSISVEEKQDCTTTFYNETEIIFGNITSERNVYGNCLFYQNYTLCLNTTGSNTDCSAQQSIYNITCITGKESYQHYGVIGSKIVTKNTTNCNTKSYVVSINKGLVTERKEVDFSNWGACIYNTENNCLIVTCQSIYDGANDGQFHGCTGGTSCQRFQICDNGIRVFYKNSRKDFVEQDPTFHLSRLALKEAGQ